jgi:hypothetical protein
MATEMATWTRMTAKTMKSSDNPANPVLKVFQPNLCKKFYPNFYHHKWGE